MKVFLKAYINKNLGDDIFIDIVSKRYPNTKFLVDSKAKYFNNENLVFYNKNIIKKIIGKILYYISFETINYETLISLKCDLSIFIGGSMFIEKTSPQLTNLKKPLYIIGSNFGPYESAKYLKKQTNLFSRVTDVCFRDKKSYKLFKNLPNVRYSTDIVFSYKNPKIKIMNNKMVVFSIIDCDFKEKELGNNYRENYENTMLDLINFFHQKKYEIILMSFCKEQGDEIAIKRIIKKCKHNIKHYFYDGNIEEAINIIASSSIVVGTRFHANILGLLYGKVILPIAYSNKTINILKDLNYKGKILDIRNLEEFNASSLTSKDLEYKINISKQIKLSEQHFKKIDEILK